MELSCNVIKDILPLYAEDMVSEDTRILVQEHLQACAGCRSELENLCASRPIPADAEIDALQRVKKQIHRSKAGAVAAAVLLILSLLTAVMMYLHVPFWLQAEEAIEYVEELDDGTMKFKTTDLAWGHYQMGFSDKDGQHIGILYSGVRARVLFPVEMPEMNEASEEGCFVIGHSRKNGQIDSYANEVNYYYLNYADGTASNVLWEGLQATASGESFFSGGIYQPSWVLRWLCIGTAALACVFVAAGMLGRKKKILLFLAAVFGSIVLSSLLITSGRFLTLQSSELYMKLCCIAVLSGLISAAALCFMKLHSR